jgi:hypothetical protein
MERFREADSSMLQRKSIAVFVALVLSSSFFGCNQYVTQELGGTFEFYSPTLVLDVLPRQGEVRGGNLNITYTLSKAAAHLDKPGAVLVGFQIRVPHRISRRGIERLIVDAVLSDLHVQDAEVLSFD